MSRYGSTQFSVFLADGRNLLGAKPQQVTVGDHAAQEQSDGLGDSWEEFSPTGKRIARMTQDGAFFDDATHSIHETWQAVPGTPSDPPRIVCVGWAGNVIGRVCVGLDGAFGVIYEVLAQVGKLTRANVTYRLTGRVDWGVILQEYEERTADWNTFAEGQMVDDYGAATSDGGAGYLQVTSIDQFGAVVGRIMHSVDGVVWDPLITFPPVTAAGAPTAVRLDVAGTVRRYLCFDGNVFGDASRSPSASVSPSASLSPSVSASVSISPSSSRSPSASLSPSLSASASASPSLSPSVSASVSASASISPSMSASPSASASVSPSPAVGGTATVFCAFSRFGV